jgi:hypothetical protein
MRADTSMPLDAPFVKTLCSRGEKGSVLAVGLSRYGWEAQNWAAPAAACCVLSSFMFTLLSTASLHMKAVSFTNNLNTQCHPALCKRKCSMVIRGRHKHTSVAASQLWQAAEPVRPTNDKTRRCCDRRRSHFLLYSQTATMPCAS